MHGASRRDDRRAAGFTLMEMLVVLTIIALLTAVTPALLGHLPGMRLKAADIAMADTLRQLRERAIRNGSETQMTVDPIARRYVLSSDAVPHALPTVVERLDIATNGQVRPATVRRLRFFPDGSATGATIRLWHGNQSASIAIDWLTGRISTP